MSRVVKLVEDANGHQLLVEVTGNDEMLAVTGAGEGMFSPIGAEDKLAELGNSLSSLISNTTSAILDGLGKIEKPSKVGIEFGVELAAEGKVWFIAKGSVHSTLKVSVEWEKGK